MPKGIFANLYRKLNSEQKRAVDAIEGPVMVIAGPGTGKTQILTLRIANILRKTDVPPDAILALTFTESAVFSMRRRLVEILGPAAYQVRIHTFHGFCNDVITRFPDAFPRIVGSRPVTDVERITLLQEIITELPNDVIRPFGDPFYYVRPVLSRISELKRENVSPEAFGKLLFEREQSFSQTPDLYNEKGKYKGEMKGKYATIEKRMKKDRELLAVYREYEEALRTKKLYDYDDMILETIAALESNRELLLVLQEEHQYILADEHQDANMSQNRLLELLASYHERPNLFIVGDEKQAIFRFQGASLANFLFFKERYKDAVVVTLRSNYRSTQTILDSAHTLIGYTESGVERVPLIAQGGDKGKGSLQLAELFSKENECAFIAQHIRTLLEEGVDPSEIAVLYRLNKDADMLAEALERRSVPVVVESDQNILADIDMRRFIQLLRALARYGHAAELVPALHLDFLALPSLELSRVLSRAREHGLYELLADASLLKKIGIKKTKPFTYFAGRLASWNSAFHNRGLLMGLEIVARESGFIGQLVAHQQAFEKLGLLSALFAEAETLCAGNREATLEDFVQYLTLLEDYNLSVKAPRVVRERKAVRLMTAHRSKGLEFEHVIIAHVNDGVWGNRSKRMYFSPLFETDDDLESLDDERRLFYVALTRARTSILVTYSRESESGKPMLPSQFLEELDKNLITRIDVSSFESDFSSTLTKLSVRNPAPLDPTLVRTLFLQQGLSVTALNNYLACPWKYFYLNLLRVPQSTDKHREFGTAIHKALKEFFDLLRGGDDIGAEGLIARFLRALQTAPITEREIDELEAKGRKALASFYKARIDSLRTPGVAEFRITTHMATDVKDVPQLRLRGDLDRVEFIDGGPVIVYDYKTGKRKTEREIMGTEESWGDYRRQIVFYKLLLDLHENGRHPMQVGVIDFVEPDQKGKHAQVRVEVPQKDIQALRSEIERVAGEVMTLTFTDAVCEIKDCPWCSMPIEIPQKELLSRSKTTEKKSKKQPASRPVQARYR